VGHPYKFQQVSRLGSVTAPHSSSGHQPHFASLNSGRHLYSARRPSHWALAHISILSVYLRHVCLHFAMLHLSKKTSMLKIDKPTSLTLAALHCYTFMQSKILRRRPKKSVKTLNCVGLLTNTSISFMCVFFTLSIKQAGILAEEHQSLCCFW